MTAKQAQVFATITAVVAVGGGYWLYAYFSAPPKAPTGGDIVLPSSSGSSVDSSEVASLADWQTYQNPAPAFTFKYPPTAKVGTFSDATGQTILIQSAADTLAQIYIVSYTDSATITAADISASLPSLHVTEPEAIQVLGGSGLTFTSDNNLSTPTREIWFVRDSYIYEVSIPLASQALAAQIIQTVKFSGSGTDL